jgi:hypothetical protein
LAGVIILLNLVISINTIIIVSKYVRKADASEAGTTLF